MKSQKYFEREQTRLSARLRRGHIERRSVSIHHPPDRSLFRRDHDDHDEDHCDGDNDDDGDDDVDLSAFTSSLTDHCLSQQHLWSE